jgi:hypothetical protein
MEDAQHFNPVFTDAVGNDIWRSGNPPLKGVKDGAPKSTVLTLS